MTSDCSFQMNSKIYIAGHNGMVGSAIRKILLRQGFNNIVGKSHSELNLTDSKEVHNYIKAVKPELVFICAAKVGGIVANQRFPVEFLKDNLKIQLNLIEACHSVGVKRVVFLGSSCIYPKHAEQPICEESLLDGQLELTNESYALAKITGIKLCESYNRQFNTDYRSVMPSNLYGPNDNFHATNSHVIPSLINRIHEAKTKRIKNVVVWGTGNPRREFLYVTDLAEACVKISQVPLKSYQRINDERCSHVNIGTGKDCSIRDLAKLICKVIGYDGLLDWDIDKPDGTPRKLLDVRKMQRLGIRSSTSLHDGLEKTYQWYVNRLHSGMIRT